MRTPDLGAIVLAVPAAGGAPPLDSLAGLALALRTVLTLQKERFAPIALVVADGAEGDRVAALVARDTRVHRPLEVLRPGDIARQLVTGACLVARHDVAVAPALYDALRVAAGSANGPVIAVRDGRPVGPFVATPELAGLPGMTGALAGAPLDDALAWLTSVPGALALDAGTAWHERLDRREGRRRAFRALFDACRKPVDGVISRNLNRHVSIFISKGLVSLPLTPNMLSALTFALGIAGAVHASRGGYWDILLGAFLFQWNSILDGCDGELARVRFQHSKLGQWVDTVCDDVSNWIFYAGLGVGALHLPYGELLAACAVIAIVASLIATAQYYTEMWRRGTGDLYAIDWEFDKGTARGLGGKLLVFFRNTLKKDFAIFFFLVLAVLGVLPWALPIIAGGSVGTTIAATRRNLIKRRAARALT